MFNAKIHHFFVQGEQIENSDFQKMICYNVNCDWRLVSVFKNEIYACYNFRKLSLSAWMKDEKTMRAKSSCCAF